MLKGVVMRLSKQDTKFFSSLESLLVPAILFLVYTCPLAYIAINTIVKGCFWTAFKNGLWVMFLWGGTATLFAFYFVFLFFVARKLR